MVLTSALVMQKQRQADCLVPRHKCGQWHQTIPGVVTLFTVTPAHTGRLKERRQVPLRIVNFGPYIIPCDKI